MNEYLKADSYWDINPEWSIDPQVAQQSLDRAYAALACCYKREQNRTARIAAVARPDTVKLLERYGLVIDGYAVACGEKIRVYASLKLGKGMLLEAKLTDEWYIRQSLGYFGGRPRLSKTFSPYRAGIRCSFWYL